MAQVIDLKELQRLPDRELLQHVLGEDVLEHITSLAEAFGLQLGDEARKASGRESYRLLCARELLSRALVEQLQARPVLGDPAAVKEFLRLKIGGLAYESFWVLYLDAQVRLIRAEEMFRGTLTQTSVYPREIIKRSLQLNAASVIFSHNHPSGASHPSRADEALTSNLRAGLSLVDIRVLDHIIVGGTDTCSMAAMGLM